MDVIYVSIIVFWFATAILHSIQSSESIYSKLTVWLAVACITILSLSNLF